MPTGYTAKILTGEIKTFEEFAILCMRAFGATIHMRDEHLDKSYEKRVPSSYYQIEMGALEKKISEINNMSDEELVQKEKTNLLSEINRLNDVITNKTNDSEVLKAMLLEVERYTPPTPEHESIKNFMIEQIKMTTNHDCDIEYYSDLIKKYSDAIENLEAKSLREEKMQSFVEDLGRMKKNFQKEKEICDESNQWVEDFLKSLKKSEKV